MQEHRQRVGVLYPDTSNNKTKSPPRKGGGSDWRQRLGKHNCGPLYVAKAKYVQPKKTKKEEELANVSEDDVEPPTVLITEKEWKKAGLGLVSWVETNAV